jgi:hypothetical protein
MESTNSTPWYILNRNMSTSSIIRHPLEFHNKNISNSPKSEATKSSKKLSVIHLYDAIIGTNENKQTTITYNNVNISYVPNIMQNKPT